MSASRRSEKWRDGFIYDHLQIPREMVRNQSLSDSAKQLWAFLEYRCELLRKRGGGKTYGTDGRLKRKNHTQPTSLSMIERELAWSPKKARTHRDTLMRLGYLGSFREMNGRKATRYIVSMRPMSPSAIEQQIAKALRQIAAVTGDVCKSAPQGHKRVPSRGTRASPSRELKSQSDSAAPEQPPFILTTSPRIPQPQRSETEESLRDATADQGGG